MIFTETALKGAFIIDIEKREDNRGFFARGFCAEELDKQGLIFSFVQCNISSSDKKHTLRGMHYQINGAEEVKIVRCTKGSLLDVIIDVREDSPTYCQHIKVELSETNHRMLYIPKGFAHGFITLEYNIELFYMVSEPYAPGKEAAIRWDDPTFDIQWPTDKPILSEKDANCPDFEL